MKKIQVIGSGCPTCKQLFKNTQQAVEDLGWQENSDYTLEYVNDVTALIDLGVMRSPVLVVDEKPILVGSLANPSEIKQLLQEESK